MAGSRGTWNSRFGFLMAAVGSAVGLGNLVRFPKELANQGGAAFLLVYLGLLLLVGLPAMLGELGMGKLTNASPLNAFKQLAGEGRKGWTVLGAFGVLAAVFVLFFYTVIAGWALRFVFESFRDSWFDDPSGLFGQVAFGPWAIIWNLVVTIIVVAIVARGISGGIEKASVIMMPTLFVIVIGIAIFAGVKDALSGFEGMKTVWQPDFGELRINHVTKATGQVFFSLSLGQGAMLTYASYMDKKQSITKDGTTIAFADTGVAVLGAMMVFPILGFTGLLSQYSDAGTFGMAFEALPNAFVAMGAVIGRVVGTVFFLGLFFAALSSAISLLEVPVSVAIDNLKWSRARAAVFVGLITYTFGVLSAISEDWLNLFDEISINLFIVIGVAFTTFFAGWFVKDLPKELDLGLKRKVSVVAIWMMRTVTPALILITFVMGGLWGTDASGHFQFWYGGGDGGTSANWLNLWHELQKAFGA